MSDYKVSVIVPIYNVEQYINRALDSLVNQTLKELEVILVDDGSIDNSGKIADEYAEKYINFSVIHKKNGGLSDARNVGMKNASAPYIGFIDPDDYIESDMFERLFCSANTIDSDLVICGYLEEYSDNSTHERRIDFNSDSSAVSLIEEFIKGNVGAYAWNKLYKTSIIESEGLQFPKGIQVVEDTIFFSEYLKYIKNYYVVDDLLYHYIRNSNSICAKYHKRQFEYYRLGYLAKCSLLNDVGGNDELNEINDINYLKTCYRVLDQINSVSNKARFGERRDATFLAVNDDTFQSLLKKYGSTLNDKDCQKKYKYIISKRLNSLILYEFWKMRIVARIKYYLT